HVQMQTGPGHRYIFTIRNHPSMKSKEIAFAIAQRKWAVLSLDQEVVVAPFAFKSNQYIGAITLSADFQLKKNATTDPLNSDFMAREFSMQFGGMAFTRGELLVFQFNDPEKGKTFTLSLVVKNLEGIDLNAAASGDEKSKPFPFVGYRKSAFRSIINPDWDFQKMGIGGLDKEFSGIFRRAFASRVFPPEFIEQLGMKHVRGILLFGPPGTGKTLMARQIGKMLNAREPKIVNGPQILDKYVGESESNVRKLFADAEEEWRRCGSNSGLHIIIFDEIDAICKQRGSMAGSSSVHDTVVNQLLSKMDGVEQLNNILVIGMTNRKDMIDEALLRPGRLEVQMEVSLPDEFGRLQILRIHTSRMREYKKLDPEVNLEELAKRTKNFSGAEIEGLVRAAQSSAMNRLVKAGGKVQLDPDAIDKLMINAADFDYALENDIKPAFGRSDESLEKFLRRGMVVWGSEVTRILEEGARLVEETVNPDAGGFVTAVLAGPPRSGKSFLAAEIARASDFPLIKVVSPGDMVGFSESAKCQCLRKAFADAFRSRLSVLLIDNVERLLDYSPVGPRFSNLVLQALLVLLNEPPPQGSGHVIDVPVLTTPAHIMHVLQESDVFTQRELDKMSNDLQSLLQQQSYGIGIKRLLGVIDFCRKCEEGYRAQMLVSKIEAIALGME
ncbi:ATPase, AAA family, partial [Teladorsagia circumcincta]